MYCKNCGKEIDAEAKFCQHCGTAVTNVIPEQTNSVELVEPATERKAKKKRSIFSSFWFWLVAVILLLRLLFGPSDYKLSDPVDTTSALQGYSESEYKAMCEGIEFKQLARNPDNYEGQNFVFTGEVIQVMEGKGIADIRLNVTKVTSEYSDWVYYEDTIYATVHLEDGADKILEEDIITIYGVCAGSYSYTSVLGSQVTLPKIDVKYYELVE